MRSAEGGGHVIGARFRLLRVVKAAHGIETWLAADLEHPGLASMKVVEEGAVPPGLRVRWAHEAEALRAVFHPCVASPLAVGREEGVLFLAAPWVAGETLAERLARGPLTIAETLRVGRCLLGALASVHDRGVVHGDVKPSNVVLDLPRAVLIDFGFARGAPVDDASQDLPAGTERYAAPEQRRLLDSHPDERSDLYAVGAVLSACLAGPPTAGSDHEGGALREVIRHLMQDAPRDRYQSAAGALADLEQVERQLLLGLADPVFVVGLQDRRGTLAEPAFVGRARELAALEAHVERASRGDGSLVLLEAESGMGKTRLLDELARRCGDRCALFRGRGVVEVGASPFRLLTGVVGALVGLAKREPALASALCEELRDHREALCAVFPELTAVFGPVAVRESGPESLGEARTLAAFAALLEALGTDARPALILLDDCQWADEVVLKLLQSFHERRSQATRSCHVLVVVSFRSEEVPEPHPLRRLLGAPLLALPPLGASETARLLESMAGGRTVPAEALTAGRQLSDGSPFMIGAVLQGMVECGALVAEGGAFRTEPAALGEVQSSRAAAEFLVRRMEKLPAHTLGLLSAGAVLGREFEVELASALAAQSPSELLAARGDARRRHLVWIRDHGSRLVFVHDKLREALLSRMSDAERRRLHLEAALRLEVTDPTRSFEISYHFDAADAPHLALQYALSAGNEARARHALDVAEQHYRIARRGAPRQADPIQLRIAEGLGDILMLRGRYGEAARELECARRLAGGRIDAARLEGKLGELAFKSGDVATAGAHVEGALRLLGRRVPRRPAAVLALLTKELLVQALHSLLPRIFVGRRPLDGAEATPEFLAIRLYSRLAHVCWFQRGNAATLWAHLREMNLAERYPPTLALAQAYSEHAPVMTMIPWYSRGIDYARRSHEIRRSLGDAWGQGQSLHFLGVVLYAASRFEESIRSCGEAIRLLDRMGDRWEVNTARWHVAYCHYRQGALRAAVDEAQQVFRAGQEIGDAQARGIGLAIWSKASSGLVPSEPIREERARVTDDVHTHAEVLQADAVRLLALGRPGDAAAVLREARSHVDRAGLKQEYVAPVLPWLTTALRQELEVTPAHAPARREALLREALRLARRAVRMARSYRNNLPHALRERGHLLAMTGRADASRRCLDESVAWAERLGMGEEAARSRLARGRIGLLQGWAGAEDDVTAAEAALRTLDGEPAARPPGVREHDVAPRVDGFVEAARRLTSARTREEVFAAARVSGAALLREEHCLVLAVSGAAVQAVEEGAPWSFSRAAVRQALTGGELAVLATAEESGPGGTRVRTALCTPIRVRDRIAACLYASRPLQRPFQQLEVRLVELLASLAGAALEVGEVLQEAERRRASFIAVLSHEIRNPLAAVHACVYALGRSPGREAATRLRAILERQLLQLTRLADDMLDATRISLDKLRLHCKELDLSDLAHGIAEDQRPAFADHDVALEVVAGDGPLRVNADPWRLRQAIGSVLENAAKFTPPGGHAVLSLRRASDWAVVTVQDDGAGIAPDLLSHVFEPFVQADQPLARSSGGLGLGLTLAKELVELHGGEISAFSEGSGKGARFVIRLPLQQGGAISLAERSSAGGAASRGEGRMLSSESGGPTSQA